MCGGVQAVKGNRIVNHKRAIRNASFEPDLSQSDLATGEGLVRTAERLVRAFAAGEIEQQRYDALMHGIEVIAALRRQFPAVGAAPEPTAGSAPATSADDAAPPARETPSALSPVADQPAQRSTQASRTRMAQDRRRQTLDFVKAFAHDVAAARPVAIPPATRLRSTRGPSD
jgi:ribosome-binding protein aMBF1 (putative translation factor)